MQHDGRVRHILGRQRLSVTRIKTPIVLKQLHLRTCSLYIIFPKFARQLCDGVSLILNVASHVYPRIDNGSCTRTLNSIAKHPPLPPSSPQVIRSQDCWLAIVSTLSRLYPVHCAVWPLFSTPSRNEFLYHTLFEAFDTIECRLYFPPPYI